MVLFTGADDVSENTMEMNKSKSGKGRKKLPVRILKGPKTDSKQVLCSMCVVFICWYCSKRGLGFRTCVQSLWHVSIKYVQFKKRKFNVGSWLLPWHACLTLTFFIWWQVFETQLAKVKQRVMTYLGRLGGEVNHALLSGSDVCEEAIAWDAEQHLRFDVPFMDMKPQIYFGEYIWMLHAYIVCEKFYKCWRIKNVEAFYWFKLTAFWFRGKIYWSV